MISPILSTGLHRDPARLSALVLPGMLALLVFATLLALGTWQVHRLHWKQDLLAQISRAETAPAVPLPTRPSPYQKVSVTGRLRPDLAVLFAAEVHDISTGPAMGADLIVPLEREGAEPVLVDLGWIPESARETISLPQGTTTVAGYVRPTEPPALFTPNPDLARRHFYSRDTAAIGAAVGLPNVAPFTLVAMGPRRPAVYPIPAQHFPQPPNNHLQYALTWYGLAGALVVVFVSWSRKVLKE
ncbi:MAG TPA: SURF1 family protein [Acetobacteraceae bacterium]|nr:SURF1 family protein [Acetobacteraceae bacterium]